MEIWLCRNRKKISAANTNQIDDIAVNAEQSENLFEINFAKRLSGMRNSNKRKLHNKRNASISLTMRAIEKAK